MASNNNYQRGIPAHQQQQQLPQQQQQQPQQQGGNGQRRRRPRDVNRMADWNNRKNEQAHNGGGWSGQVDIEERREYLLQAPPQQKNRPQQNQRRGPPPAAPSKSETAPKDEVLYTGANRGSKPVKKSLAQNFDCAGFIPLVRQVYDRMCIEDQRIPRSLPFPIFQHAMTEFLNAYMLHQAKYILKVPILQPLMDPLISIGAEDLNVPQPIYEYICGIGPAITPTGDNVYWNLPSSAIPKMTTTENEVTVRPGSFGPVTAQNHNVYECYVSPYVTSEYVIQASRRAANSNVSTWRPLPTGWFPATGVPTENFLGYRELQKYHPDAAVKLRECDFDSSETITGMLCHSAYAMTLTSSVIGTLDKMKLTKGLFKAKENSAAFIYKYRDADDNRVDDVLWDYSANLRSPFAFSAVASNRANFMAYKRQRIEASPGTCYLTADAAPAGWLPTINANFNCEGEFGLQRGYRDRASLRANDHEEEEGYGPTSQDIYTWLDSTMIKR